MNKKRRSRQYKDSSKVIDMEEARAKRLAKRRAAKKASGIQDKNDEVLSGRQLKRRQDLRKRRTRKRLIVIIVTAIIVIIAGTSIFHIVKLKREEHQLLKQQEQLQQEKEDMKKDIENTEDLERIEDEARSKLKMIKPGEIVYIPEDD